MVSKENNTNTARLSVQEENYNCSTKDTRMVSIVMWQTRYGSPMVILKLQKILANIPVMELSTTNGGNINDWEPVQEKFRKNWLEKTNGRYVIYNSDLKDDDVKFIDEHLRTWVGYCEETLFDINLSVIDSNNVMVISQNSEVYDRLESLDIKVHKIPFRHRFFWDGGLHCITNDLMRETL